MLCIHIVPIPIFPASKRPVLVLPRFKLLGLHLNFPVSWWRDVLINHRDSPAFVKVSVLMCKDEQMRAVCY